MRRNPFLTSPKRTNPFLAGIRFQQFGAMNRVRLKWVRNRGLDHIIGRDTTVKAASLLKDAINRSPAGFLNEKSFADWKVLLGLSIPVLRFMRRYPTIFHEFPHPRYASLPCFRLTETAQLLDSLEKKIQSEDESGCVERLCRLLMMSKDRTLTLKTLFSLRWDLGLPDHFEKNLVPKYPDHFRIITPSSGIRLLKLENWREEFAVSALQRANESVEKGEYRAFKEGVTRLTFPMNYPRGYGLRNTVKAWMREFDKLPYVSPYEDWQHIDPSSDLMEKRVVALLHEVLSLTLHKKTKRNYIRGMREELGLLQTFTRIFTRYPGIFYLSMKCKTSTATLREGYKSGKLVDPHPLTKLRNKYHYVMRLGLIHRLKGEKLIPKEEMCKTVEALAKSESEGEDGEEFDDEDEEYSEEISDYSGESGED